MYFADIASSLYFVLGKMCSWRAQSIMAEKSVEGNVEKRAEFLPLVFGLQILFEAHE
jgi:hypothetical protein